MGGMGLMWLWLLLGLLGLWALVWAVARWAVGPRHQTPEPDALELLNQQLVKGEITTEEYRRAR